MRVLTGENVLIGGFIITGTDPKKVIIRGIGPSLNGAGITIADPTLELRQGSTMIATNDNWKRKPDGTSQQAEIEATTIPPKNDLESAIVATLNPGEYTAILAGKNGGTGVGLVEVYDLAPTANSKLANISTRGFVDSGDNVMIGGLIVGNGSGGGTAKVIVRALGPSVPVTGALRDPTLELRNSSGTVLDSNDNWKTRPDGSSQQAEIEATTIPPTNDLESAIVSTLAPGNYTAIVRGKNNTTGVGLVETYQLTGASATKAETGVAGTAVEGPIHPVERVGDGGNTMPLPGAIITLEPEGGGKELARTVADEQGNFEIAIAPGNYLVVPLPPDPGSVFPRGISQPVTVKPDAFTEIIAQYDTGIR
jgi:hypothetical protein